MRVRERESVHAVMRYETHNSVMIFGVFHPEELLKFIKKLSKEPDKKRDPRTLKMKKTMGGILPGIGAEIEKHLSDETGTYHREHKLFKKGLFSISLHHSDDEGLVNAFINFDSVNGGFLNQIEISRNEAFGDELLVRNSGPIHDRFEVEHASIDSFLALAEKHGGYARIGFDEEE